MEKGRGWQKRFAATFMVIVILGTGNPANVSFSDVAAKALEDNTKVSVDDAEVQVPEIVDEIPGTASAALANIEAKEVDVDSASIAATGVYKDMDYSFLKGYSFGNTNEGQAKAVFRSAQELEKSKDVRLRSDTVVKTEGYYSSGDGGNAVYMILSEDKMQENKMADGAIKLFNGLYACILPDIYEINDKKWVIVNAKQFGASGGGLIPSQDAIGAAANYVSNYTAQHDDIFRGLAYIPSGEYKCTNEVHANDEADINIVGDGDSTVLFTDNDYRANQGYSEFFFSSWNSQNMYFGNFRIEAREVDLYNYMRQFVLIYCDNVYVYHVNMIIPQESYSAFYFEDKQYSNFCCYSGDTNITVDECTMVQFSGTYRGANVGIMDFWNRRVENITVMNCDLYSNARDEQIGIFNIPKTGTTENKNTSISNVDLINNTIHTVPVKYTNIIGYQNMCFTVAYTDSVRIDDVRIAGNHFICEADSKFMTFGNLTNCVVENNIIEIITTRTNAASVFDSSNEDADNIIIRNNEFFLTSEDGNQVKAGFSQGKMTFEGNQVFSDSGMYFGVLGQMAKDNELVFLKSVGCVCGQAKQIEGNTFYLYGGTRENVCALDGEGDADKKVSFKGNTIYDYKRSIGSRGPWDALVKISATGEIAEFSNNKYYAPNKQYTSSGQYKIAGEMIGTYVIKQEEEDVDWTDANGKREITHYYNRMFYLRGPDDGENSLKKVIFQNNILQGVKGYTSYGKVPETYSVSGNTLIPYREDLSEDECLVSSVDILYNNKKVTELSVTGDKVNLDKLVQIAQRDEEGNILNEQEKPDQEIKWYTSVKSMASVDQKGVVTRHMYGDVTVYAVPTDGSGIYGECTIHFLENRAAKVSFAKESIQLQPGLKYYADYTVLPKEASRNLKWTSSNEAVATVSGTGLITGNAVGKAVITGTTTDGSNLSASISVEVKPVTVKKMVMDNTWFYFGEEEIGTSRQLAVKEYTPDNATNKKVKRWESSDTSVATVDSNGKVTAVGNGVTQIRAYSTDEYCYANCEVFVEPSKVTNFKAANIGKNSMELTWERVNNCYGYYIYQWDTNTSAWKLLTDKALAQDVTSYTVGNLADDTEYKFCIRSYFRNWSSSERPLYESKDSILTVKTLGYQPVTSIKGSADVFTVVGVEKRGTFTITYAPSTDNFKNLDISYKMEDESIAKVISFSDGEKQGEKTVVIEGQKYGMTNLIITSNDERHKTVKIPVGVITSEKVSDCTAEAVYKQITIQFKSLGDESNIDGYLVQLVDGYRFIDVGFVKKTGAETYSYVDKNVAVGENAGPRGAGYGYTVSPCLTDGSCYSIGNRVRTNGEQAVFVPEPTVAKSLKFKEETYIVAEEDTVEVSAKVGDTDASSSELYWEVIDERNASVERFDKKGGEDHADYAKITGIDAGVTQIKAVTTDGSNLEEMAELIVVPRPVTDIKTKSDLTSISLSWTAVKNADGYSIYRWDESKKDFQLVSEVEENSFRDLNLVEDTTYRYKIAAYMYVDEVKYDGKHTQEIIVSTTKNDNKTENSTSAEKTTNTQENTQTPDDAAVKMDKSFRALCARVTKTTNKSNRLVWSKVKNADGYIIYGAAAGKKKNKKLAEKKASVTKYTHKKLKKGTYYKYVVKAYRVVNGKKVMIACSKTVYSTTDGGKYGNARSIKVNKKKIALKKGKTFKLKVKVIRKNRKIRSYAKIGYESTNNKIATVSKKGVIKAKKKGSCMIYVYAQNGIYKKIKVTVK